MNCHKVQSLISAYVDCELAGLEMLAIRRHLSECAECNNEFESLLRVKRAFGSLSAKHPADDLASRICAQLDSVPLPPYQAMIAAIRKHLTTPSSHLRWATAGIGAFALLLVLSAGPMSTNDPQLVPGVPASIVGLAEREPIKVPTMIPVVEAGSLSPTESPEPAPQPWEFTVRTANSHNIPSSLTLARY